MSPTDADHARALVSDGLCAKTAAAFSELIQEITGKTLCQVAFLAPVFLLSAPEPRGLITLPPTEDGTVLIHDYQRLDLPEPFELDAPVSMELRGSEKDIRAKLFKTGEEVASMHTSLRAISITDLAVAKPLATGVVAKPTDAACSIGQTQIDRYLALSGDQNPLHAQDYASEAGLRSAVIPGVFLASLVQSGVEAEMGPGHVCSARIRFMAPAFTHDPLWVSVERRGKDRCRAFVQGEKGAYLVADLQMAHSMA